MSTEQANTLLTWTIGGVFALAFLAWLVAYRALRTLERLRTPFVPVPPHPARQYEQGRAPAAEDTPTRAFVPFDPTRPDPRRTPRGRS